MTIGPTEIDPLLPPDDANTKLASKNAVGPLQVTASARYGILCGVFTATFMSALNLTLVPTMLPSISSEFNASHQASWLGTAYLLATSTFNPLYGRLSDVLGRRLASLTAVCFIALGTLACGLSKDMNSLILARFIAGIGGGGVFVISSIVTSDLYSLRSRALTQGVASLFSGLGMGLGGPVGGLITDWLGWRWAFLLQIPISILSLSLIAINLHYVTPGAGRNTKEILKRIDWTGSFLLLTTTASCLFFLSTRFNEGLEWGDIRVITPLTLAGVSGVSFVFVELCIANEPVLDPVLLRQRVPVLTSISNFLVANCNFTINYFFPMWFQTVMLTSASIAGLHLAPNSICMSLGSLFAGWMIHRTGKYRMLNLVLGALPFLGTQLILYIREDSGPIQTWFSIIPLGFGNAIVMQTMQIALLAHLPDSQIAVGTGFGVLFRGVGQVGGVAISSAIFQHVLDKNLHRQITGPNADELIRSIRHSARLVSSLPPDIQRQARDSYSASLHSVFLYASCSTALAYIVRLAVPEKSLDRDRAKKVDTQPEQQGSPVQSTLGLVTEGRPELERGN